MALRTASEKLSDSQLGRGAVGVWAAGKAVGSRRKKVGGDLRVGMAAGRGGGGRGEGVAGVCGRLGLEWRQGIGRGGKRGDGETEGLRAGVFYQPLDELLHGIVSRG